MTCDPRQATIPNQAAGESGAALQTLPRQIAREPAADLPAASFPNLDSLNYHIAEAVEALTGKEHRVAHSWATMLKDIFRDHAHDVETRLEGCLT